MARARVHVEVYGCSASYADGEMIMGLLRERGYELSDESRSDVNVIVTCCVKTPTANRMLHRIRLLGSKPLVVAGCMPKAERSSIEKVNPNASLVGPDRISKVVDAVEAALEGRKAVYLDGKEIKLGYPRVVRNPVVGIVEIGSGCLGHCTFCQTKLAKGRLFSYPPELILKEVERFVKAGAKEIWLTSTDDGAYGLDRGLSIGELVKMVARVEGEFMIRVGMMSPEPLKKVLDGLLEAYELEKVFKFAHVPVQSGSDRVLSLMGRGYTSGEFSDLVKRLREVKGMTIATDVIVGFPTESEDEFYETVELIRRLKPDVVNLSKFSARPGTEAFRMKQLDNRTVKSRSVRMAKVIRDVTLKVNEKWIGWEGYALVDERVKGAKLARNSSYRPIVVPESFELGSWVKVKIGSVTPNCLLSLQVVPKPVRRT